MNYKRHRNKIRRHKKKELKGSLKGWAYGKSIAKEVVYRQEFRKQQSSLCGVATNPLREMNEVDLCKHFGNGLHKSIQSADLNQSQALVNSYKF